MKYKNEFSKTKALKWRILTIFSILFLLGIGFLLFMILLKVSGYLGNIINPQNSELYEFIIFVLIILGMYSIVAFFEYKDRKRYLPVTTNDISIEQRKYIYNRINKLVDCLIREEIGSIKLYNKEYDKRFKWMQDKKLMENQEDKQKDIERKVSEITMLKEKLDIGNMDDKDMKLLNTLLKNTWKLG